MWKSYRVLQPVISEIAQENLDLGYHSLVQGKQTPLTIQPLKNANIMEVTFQHENLQKISPVLAHLAQPYINYGNSYKNIRVNQRIEFTTEQVSQLR